MICTLSWKITLGLFSIWKLIFVFRFEMKDSMNSKIFVIVFLTFSFRANSTSVSIWLFSNLNDFFHAKMCQWINKFLISFFQHARSMESVSSRTIKSAFDIVRIAGNGFEDDYRFDMQRLHFKFRVWRFYTVSGHREKTMNKISTRKTSFGIAQANTFSLMSDKNGDKEIKRNKTMFHRHFNVYK